jgi:hypothetical protein
MNREVRLRLDMAGRVRDFSWQHMFDDPSYTAIVTSFEAHLDRAEELATQQRAGRLTSRGSTARRIEARRSLHLDLLPYLVRLGQVVAETAPELGQRFVMPSSKSTNAAYRTAARAMFDEASAARERFIAAGMTQQFLTDLGLALAEFDAAVEAGRGARAAHVGARADLEVVTGKLMKLMNLLDGLNRYRFRNNPELSAAWLSARKVVAVPQPRPASPDDSVKPAA